MGIRASLGSLFDTLAKKLNSTVQGEDYEQRVRDYHLKGNSYSIESEISEKLAALTMMLSTMPISGDSERALWLDTVSDEFYRTKAVKALISGFLTGDCLIVPSWTGRTIQNILVPSDEFRVFSSMGDEVTSYAYIVDRTTVGTTDYQLLQAVELVPYGEGLFANRYRMFVARDWKLGQATLEDFPEWKDKYESEWFVPNVDRLLVGRFKSFTADPMHLNNIKGVPICFGASEPIQEIRYLLDKMHSEFGLSEKFIMADKRLFKRGEDGLPMLPKGKDSVFMNIGGYSSDLDIHEWSPDIRYTAYLEAIDKQEQLVERAVGVSGGIISKPNEMNYQNVDNVRKSQQATMSFVNNARTAMEDCMTDLVYSWNVLANYYEINPIGDFNISFDWSDDYIETFADRQNAILAGNAIGATDAVDYRMFLYDESPEAARDRVAEIKASTSDVFIDVLE